MGKYWKWYWSIVENAKNRPIINGSYFEVHHIIPRSLGGDDSEDNKVALTAKEHFVCHHLLTKITYGDDRVKMWNAFFIMHMNPTTRSSRYFTARTFQIAKIKMAQSKKALVGEKNHFYGRKHTETTKEKMSASWNRGLRQHKRDVYTFVHEDGTEFTGMRCELCEKYNINHKYVHKIVSGYQKSTKGWRVLNG